MPWPPACTPRHFDLKTSTHTELFGLFNCVITGDQVGGGLIGAPPAPCISPMVVSCKATDQGADGSGSSSPRGYFSLVHFTFALLFMI